MVQRVCSREGEGVPHGGAVGYQPVEEQVHGDLPGGAALDDASQPQHLASKQVVQQTDTVLPLVVCRDGDVHKVEGGVAVHKGDDGDAAHIAGLLDGLVVDTGVCDDQQTRLLELQ